MKILNWPLSFQSAFPCLSSLCYILPSFSFLYSPFFYLSFLSFLFRAIYLGIFLSIFPFSVCSSVQHSPQGGSITVWLITSLAGLDFTKQDFLLFACTETKLLNPNQSNWRQAVQWYLPPTLSVLWVIIHAAFSLINLQLFVVLSQCHRLLNKCTPQKEENNSIEGHKGTAKYQSLQCILFDSHHWSVCYSESTFLNCQSQIWLIGG